MLKVNMHDAKSRLSKLVEQALSGEDVVIAKAGVFPPSGSCLFRGTSLIGCPCGSKEKSPLRPILTKRRRTSSRRSMGVMDEAFAVGYACLPMVVSR